MAIDYNAAFTGAIARLVDFYDNMQPFSDCTLDLGWTHPNATLVSLWVLPAAIRGTASALLSVWTECHAVWLPSGYLKPPNPGQE